LTTHGDVRTTPSVTLVRVFDRAWAAWLEGVDRCRRKASRRAVHALRLDCRRLEALVDVLGYATGAPPKALRRLGRIAVEPLHALSQLRDDQVQRRRIGRAPAGRGTEALLHYVRRREARHQKQARRALAALDLAAADALAHRVRTGLLGRQGAPTPGARTRRLRAAVSGAASTLQTRLARVDAKRPRTLHRVRVALKRVRYAAEIAEAVSPGIRIASQPMLRSLQQRLGAVHDADVLGERIDRAVKHRRARRKDVRGFAQRVKADRARSLQELTQALPGLQHVTHRTAR
jgi:CHAD domain-containing protein